MAIAAVVISVVSLIVAVVGLMTVAQHVWGKPQISIRYESDDREDKLFLECAIFNNPVTSGFKKFCRVKIPTAEEIRACYRLENGNGDEICSMTNAEIRIQRGPLSERIALPASHIPVTLPVVHVVKPNCQSKVFDRRENQIPLGIGSYLWRSAGPIKLLPGVYKVTVKIFAGTQVLQDSRTLTIQDDSPFAFWNSV